MLVRKATSKIPDTLDKSLGVAVSEFASAWLKPVKQQ